MYFFGIKKTPVTVKKNTYIHVVTWQFIKFIVIK